jgi:hypothetical protein
MNGKMLINANATTHSQWGVLGRGELPTASISNLLLFLGRRGPLTLKLGWSGWSEPTMLIKSTLIERFSK